MANSVALDGGGRNRWGDYSATVLDPTDPGTFWVFQEYTAQDAGNVDVGPGEAEGGLWGIRAVELTFNEVPGNNYEFTQPIEMRFNELLSTITGSPDEYGEWAYFLSIFGNPGDAAWGWQIDGHHLIVNCAIVGDQVVLSDTSQWDAFDRIRLNC